jgi:hypothetical protein
MEEIGAFLAQKMSNLAEVIAGDPFLGPRRKFKGESKNLACDRSKPRTRLASHSDYLQAGIVIADAVPQKRRFYEQVAGVKGFVLFIHSVIVSGVVFVLTGLHCCSQPCFYSHLERAVRAPCRLGQKEESMLPVIGRPYQGPTRHGSSGRGVRNSELLRLLPHRTVHMAFAAPERRRRYCRYPG